ncbi:lysophospholipid acyltransferase 7-like [Thamnophis elegans]|uniref:lysophospholipid acyltransferase 7-like n=1 Tax=Thamnophis elegans TaxID=35005 RepID=UPI001377CAE7|nr:lysophospholipid acyltransferase 7-like [Thamnophis elegans]
MGNAWSNVWRHLTEDTISSVGIIYTAFLFVPIPIGFFFKKRGLTFKKYGAAAVGLGLTMAACGIHTIHSFVTIMGTWIIIKISPKYSTSLTLGWTFSYLLFFHKFTSFKFPQITHLTKSVQLLLTLKMVSIANEVQEFIQVKEQEVTSDVKSPAIGVISEIPGLPEILCYSYCYVGLMTGLFYRYRTYHDWLNQPNPSEIPTWKPLLYRLMMMPVFATTFLAVSYIWPPEYVENAAFYEKGICFRLFYMMPVSFVFRLRNYVTWYGAESACITAGLGAYPTCASSESGRGPTVEYESLIQLADGEASSVAYDYRTIQNIDPYGTEFCTKVKDGILCWNMTVQWWLHQYTYKNVAFLPRLLRYSWTMGISAYWHGFRPGYHLSFHTIPLCLLAEKAMEDGLLRHLSHSGRSCADWAHWFLKMRAYDYVCVGFLLRSFEGTNRYWKSVYYCVHVGAFSFLVAGKAMGALSKGKFDKKRE